MIVWAGPVEISSYDIETNPLRLRAQSVYTDINGVYSEIYFDKQGIGHVMGAEA